MTEESGSFLPKFLELQVTVKEKYFFCCRDVPWQPGRKMSIVCICSGGEVILWGGRDGGSNDLKVELGLAQSS